MQGPALIDVPLENRDRISALKKLNTAVSIESPELFRIRGVPCIDRGPDRLRPPVAYEHWKHDSTTSGQRGIAQTATGATFQPVKKTANFARPSSVSADTPNFFKVPGVAINSSSAITGVEAVCSPPPEHQPFRLPGTYMHGRETKGIADRVVVPGQWRETDRKVGQWGHATREFHEAVMKMRREGAAAGNHKVASTPKPKSGETTFSSRSTFLKKPAREAQPGFIGLRQQASGSGNRAPCTPQRRSTEEQAPSPSLSRRPRPIASAEERRRPHRGSPPPGDVAVGLPGDRAGRLAARGKGAIRDAGGSQRRVSAVEVFMSRLEGERGPKNRGESIEAFKCMLKECQTNNSAQLRDDAVAAVADYGKGSTGNELAAMEHVAAQGTLLRNTLARREEAHSVVAGLMGTAKGAYMLDHEADASKILLGLKRPGKTPAVGRLDDPFASWSSAVSRSDFCRRERLRGACATQILR